MSSAVQQRLSFAAILVVGKMHCTESNPHPVSSALDSVISTDIGHDGDTTQIARRAIETLIIVASLALAIFVSTFSAWSYSNQTCKRFLEVSLER